jgi:hypothetical protein
MSAVISRPHARSRGWTSKRLRLLEPEPLQATTQRTHRLGVLAPRAGRRHTALVESFGHRVARRDAFALQGCDRAGHAAWWARNTAGKHTTCQGMVIVAPPTPTEKSKPTLRPRSSSTTPFAFCRRVLCTPPATATPPPTAE